MWKKVLNGIRKYYMEYLTRQEDTSHCRGNLMQWGQVLKSLLKNGADAASAINSPGGRKTTGTYDTVDEASIRSIIVDVFDKYLPSISAELRQALNSMTFRGPPLTPVHRYKRKRERVESHEPRKRFQGSYQGRYPR
jgi:hypothetical protein